MQAQGLLVAIGGMDEDADVALVTELGDEAMHVPHLQTICKTRKWQEAGEAGHSLE
jgi:hypothetical protein